MLLPFSTARGYADRVLIAALLATLAVYWAGLSGGYVHDDFSFLVDNADVHVQSLRLGDWIRAAMSFPSNQQGRWATMLTFAANYYATGLDPFWMKLTNLGIHLLNGTLLYLALVELLRLWRARDVGEKDPTTQQRDALVAAGIAACWLLLPINLTGVLYVAQRLESLSNTWVFLGLWRYFHHRARYGSSRRGMFGAARALVLCTGVGLLFKESAALLPAYTFCAEFALGAFARGGARRPLTWMYGLILGLPLLAGMVWLLSWVDFSAAGRGFSGTQRVLTEWRVLVDYLGWTLVPRAHSLGLYHDDIPLSNGLLDPPSTLFALLFLLGLFGLALQQRRTRPLFCIGVLWFFIGHSMTATFVPLEIVYEHRNYFPSCGVLLALASLLALDPVAHLRGAVAATVGAAFALFFGFSTALRAHEWAHPVNLALAEAEKHPLAPRAQYELGRTLVIASGYKADSPLLARAREALERCMPLAEASVLCEQGLIIVAGRVQQPAPDAWWDSMIGKLKKRPASESDVSALQNLFECQANGACQDQHERLGAALSAAIAWPKPNPRGLLLYGEFAAFYLHDDATAEHVLRQVIALKPHLAAARANLVAFLLSRGKLDSAQHEFDELQKQNYFGSIDYMVDPLREQLREAQKSAQAAPAAPG